MTVRTHARSSSPTRAVSCWQTAAVFVPAPGGSARLLLEAESSGCAIADPAGLVDQPELAAASVARLVEDDAFRNREGVAARARAAAADFALLAERLEGIYKKAARRRRPAAHATPADGDPLAGRDWIVVDLHMHTHRSHDCSIDPQALVDHAEAEGLGAIAVTDHNVFAGALETVALAKHRKLIVIPGEEVKTDNQGEVIGLFLREEIPRGMTFGETIEAIRAQDGIVYVPHPFDRMHAIPSAATLLRHLPEIDVLEVYNARLLKDSFNAEALRFQRKYGLLAGAGSDAHVLQGVGTGALRMRRFDGPGGVPALAAHRRGAAPAEVARLPAVAEMGGSGQGEGPARAEVGGASRDCFRAHRRDLRTLSPEGDRRDQRAPVGASRARRRDPCSRARVGASAR